jgi:cytoskeletal protein RodZ
VSEPIGVYLARQRELRGISLDDLAEATRIPRHSLERLEAGAFDARPDGFARAFVRTVAVALGLEPDDTVNRMRPEPEAARALARAARRSRLVLALVVAALVSAFPVIWVNWIAPAPPESPAVAPAGATGDPELVLRPDAVRRLAEDVWKQHRPRESAPKQGR